MSQRPMWSAAVALVWAAGAAFGQLPSAEEAVKRMRVADGFRVTVAAAEPDVRQPIHISFDGKGRMWVLQYLQYPEPAGLKALSRDQYLRTVWDKVPEAPPKGPKGADRITILQDDGTGRYKPVKDFVSDLNLCSGFCIGHGPAKKPVEGQRPELVHGVYAVQPPYLLFYPDKDRQDRPDGDPVVILSGWGMEDTHAFPNNLQWGPDGWLYGTVGSTVTNKIRGIEFQQGIWRYDPRTDRFELFSEGGGNTWGLDFDAWGNAITGTNYGAKAMLHQFPGAYYVKGFSKHGPLHNPHAYGYFDHVPVENFTGGHVTCGGVVYNGGLFDKEWAGRYIACNLLSHAVYWYDMKRVGASFTAKHGGALIETDDPWFRPVHLRVGPDGALYLADWCDTRATHLDPRDTWHKNSGRIFRIAPERGPGSGVRGQPEPFDIDKLPADKLVELLSHPNNWWRREARRVIAETKGNQAELRGLLTRTFLAGGDPLELLWAMNAASFQMFGSPDFGPVGNTWYARLLGDASSLEESNRDTLLKIMAGKGDAAFRAQCACTAKRMTIGAFEVISNLVRHDEDAADPHIPLLIWWAIEDKAIKHPDEVLKLLKSPEDWHRPMMAKHLLERIARRYAAEGNDAGWMIAARLLKEAPDAASATIVRTGIEKAVEGRRLTEPPAALKPALADLPLTDAASIRFALRLGDPRGLDAGLKLAADASKSAADRASVIPIVSETGRAEAVTPLLTLLDKGQPAAVRAAALAGLGRFAEPQISDKLLELWPTFPADLRSRAVTLLAARTAWAGKLIDAVDAGKIMPAEVPLDTVRGIQEANAALKPRLEKHWGRVGRATPGDLLARAAYIQHVVLARSRGKGDLTAGHELFVKHCATCHTLWNEGNKIGPDLTSANRKDTAWFIANIVDPNLVVRADYAAWIVGTSDGRILTGLLVEQTDAAVTLLDAKNVRTVVPKSDIEQMKPSPLSLMPEKVLDTLDDKAVVDLFAYLQSDGPKGGAPAPVNNARAPNSAPEAPAPRPSPPAPLPQGERGEKKGPLKVCLVSGSVEYESDVSLAEFQKYLEANFDVQCSRAFRKADDDLPGLENLETCDVMLLFTRRLTIDGEQLERVKKHFAAGKPVVGVRTASHAFQKWLELDKLVLGGNYKNHYKEGPRTEVSLTDKAKTHPVMSGVKAFSSPGSLYRNTGHADDCEVLMTGSNGTNVEPIAWTRTHNGGRVFYTSLGHQKDWTDDNFKRLMVNALFWAAGREPAPKK